jgi:hypothetical protein
VSAALLRANGNLTQSAAAQRITPQRAYRMLV